MKRFIFLAPLVLAFRVSAANVKISDLALSTSPSTNTYLEIADLNASGTNKSAKILYTNLVTQGQLPAGTLWTNRSLAFQPIAQYTNSYLGADIFASGTNNGQNITLLGNRAAYQAIFDSATHDVFGAGFYPFRASVLQGASDVSAIGQNSLATSYLTNSADIHGWGNYALFGLSATNSSNIYGKGHSAGQGAIVTDSGNLFFDGNESGLSSYFTNSFDISAFNGAFKSAGFTNSQNIIGLLINAGSSNMFNGSSNLLVVGSGATVPSGAVNGAYFDIKLNVDTLPSWTSNSAKIASFGSGGTPYFSLYGDGVETHSSFAFDGSLNGDAFTFSAFYSNQNLQNQPAAIHSVIDVGAVFTNSNWTASIFSENRLAHDGGQNPLSFIPEFPAHDDYSILAMSDGSGTSVAVGVLGLTTGAPLDAWGVIGIAQNNNDYGVGIGGSGRVGSTGGIGGYFETTSSTDVGPVLYPSVVLIDNRDTGLPLLTARTNNGTVMFQILDNGSISAGTTNRWQTGDYVTGGKIAVNVNATNYNLLTDTSTVGPFVLKSGDTMTGPLLTTGLTNTARTANTFVVAGADKSDVSTATSAMLSATLSDETGTGAAVFGTSPTFNTSLTITNGVTGTTALEIDSIASTSVPIFSIKESGTTIYEFSRGVSKFKFTGNGANSTVYMQGLSGSAPALQVASGGIGVSSSADAAGACDLILWRDGPAALQLGLDAASPVNQSFKAADGSGTDKNGANLTIQGGQSTGTGTSGAVDISTAMTGEASGSTANSYNIRAHYKSKFVALTDATTNEVIRFSLAANKVIGGQITVTTYATNSTPHLQCRTTVLAFQAVAVGTAITPTIDVVKAGTLAADSGTMTETFTIVDNGGNTFSIIDNVDSDLTSPTDRCRVVVTALNGNAAVTITDP